MLNKYFISEQKEFNDNDRTLVAWATTNDVDRDGDSLSADGWDLKSFKKNPVLMACHDYWKFPIGKVIWIKADPSDKPKGLKFKAQFAETDEGLDAWYLYRNGFMNAFSVGFDPLEEPIFDDKADGKKKPRRIYPKNELLEISCVPVPANALALVEAEKSMKTKAFKGIIEDFIIKSVIPYHDYGNADEGETWDGPGTIAQCDVAKLKKICTWYDSDNPDVKSSYKLPHHNINLKAVFRGCAAAMGRLNQTDIPEADKKGCYNHLAKHYKDFDKEPPAKDYEEFTTKLIDVTAFMNYLDMRLDDFKQLFGNKHSDTINASDFDDDIDIDELDLSELEVEIDALGEDGDTSDNVEVLVGTGDDAGIDINLLTLI